MGGTHNLIGLMQNRGGRSFAVVDGSQPADLNAVQTEIMRRTGLPVTRMLPSGSPSTPGPGTNYGLFMTGFNGPENVQIMAAALAARGDTSSVDPRYISGKFAHLLATEQVRLYEIEQPRARDYRDQSRRTKEASPGELVQYLRDLEALNPGKTWGDIASALHASFYYDVDNFRLLFSDGAQNSGWERTWEPDGKGGYDVTLGVDLGWAQHKPGRTESVLPDSPDYVRYYDGRRSNLAHAWAGIRAGLNRWGAPSRWFWERVNTHWGDRYYQVWPTAVKGGIMVAVGSVVSDDLKQYGREALDRAPDYYPLSQEYGNDLGLLIGRMFREDPQLKLLSKAVALALGVQMALMESAGP